MRKRRYSVSRRDFMETNFPPPPPSGGTPPIITHIVTPPPRQTNSGLKIFCIVLVLLLLGSVALNMLHMIGSFLEGPTATGAHSGTRFHEVVVDNHDAKDKIAIIDVAGMITSQEIMPPAKRIPDKRDPMMYPTPRYSDVVFARSEPPKFRGLYAAVLGQAPKRFSF